MIDKESTIKLIHLLDGFRSDNRELTCEEFTDLCAAQAILVTFAVDKMGVSSDEWDKPGKWDHL